jgi:hypothetical protein
LDAYLLSGARQHLVLRFCDGGPKLRLPLLDHNEGDSSRSMEFVRSMLHLPRGVYQTRRSSQPQTRSRTVSSGSCSDCSCPPCIYTVVIIVIIPINIMGLSVGCIGAWSPMLLWLSVRAHIGCSEAHVKGPALVLPVQFSSAPCKHFGPIQRGCMSCHPCSTITSIIGLVLSSLRSRRTIYTF